MKTNLKIFIIIFIMCIFSFSYVQAIGLMFNNAASFLNAHSSNTQADNLVEVENTLNEEPSENENIYNNETQNEETDSSNNSQASSTPVITTTIEDNSLSVSDIINIILIAVCVVLIFLAVAILIRCR